MVQIPRFRDPIDPVRNPDKRTIEGDLWRMSVGSTDWVRNVGPSAPPGAPSRLTHRFDCARSDGRETRAGPRSVTLTISPGTDSCCLNDYRPPAQ